MTAEEWDAAYGNISDEEYAKMQEFYDRHHSPLRCCMAGGYDGDEVVDFYRDYHGSDEEYRKHMESIEINDNW